MSRFLVGICTLLFCFGSWAEARDLNALYEKCDFELGTVKLKAFIADDDQRRSQGLMFIKELPLDTGMLFVFDNEQSLSFWMKNTLIPLSIGFFDAKGKLVDIQEMTVAESVMSLHPPTYQSHKPAMFALEMSRGWFAKKGIRIGTQLKLVSATKSKMLSAKLKARQ